MDDDGFRDRQHRYSYLVACETARRLVENPALIDRGRRHLDRFVRHDPRQSDGYRLWTKLMEEPAAVIAERLTERSPRGDYTRETAPSFGALPGPVRARLLREARSPLPASSILADT